MKVLIDADGCPVVDITIKVSKQYGLECIIICDTAHIFKKENAKTITVSKGADSVDFALVNMIDKNDIVITQDYGLAAMCLAKCAYVINQNGLIYNDSNIDSLLLQRYTAKKIRNAGGRLRGNTKRKAQQNSGFERNFKSLIKKALLS